MNKWVVIFLCVMSVGCGVTQSTGQKKSAEALKNADVYVRLGVVYMKSKQYDASLKQLQKAVKSEPDNALAHGTLAYLYQIIKENDKAEAAYQRAIALDPRHSAILNNYGRFSCQLKQYADAAELFQRSYTNPLYQAKWRPLSNAGLCAVKENKLAQAETHFRNALQLNPRYSPALLEMADLALKQNNAPSARAYLQRYAEVAAHSPRSLWIGVRTERKLGDKNAIASYSLSLRNNFPNTKEAALLSAK